MKMNVFVKCKFGRKFSTVEARDDMLREIIRSEIQMNLAVIHENVKSDSSSIKENSKK